MTPEIVIDAQQPRRGLDFAELWRYRELFLVLIQRNITVRYKDTALGALWAVLQPVGMMLVFSVIFGRLARFSPGSVPYPLFAFAALIPWLFFANSLAGAGMSILSSRGLISKVYFPRLIVPMTAVGAPLVDFCISCGLLAMIAFYYGVYPGWSLLAVPLLTAIMALLAIGVGTLMSALTVSYRDFRHLLPFLVTLWMFLTPVIYPPTLIPEQWRWLLLFNPMAAVVGGMRSAWLGLPFDWTAIGIAGGIALVLLWCGVSYFRRVERNFVDII